ncbi:MAG TPA: protein kinase [Chthoniobacteraceae bacterium]|jgi:serine/threonine protein kinase|nr:protein kinase [Chthoniobacteraceae bacterium]
MTTDPPEATPDEPAKGLGSLDPGELLARGLPTVQSTFGQGPWIPPEPAELARLLPQYSIERLLGHGGMGAVYQGEQTALRRKVAIKLLPADLAMDAQFVARFQREARLLARLQHPGIVAVYDCGQSSEGHLYFVMEYVEGTDLQRVLRDPGLNPEQAMELIMQICDALHYAHRQGVIHRDIKPANILLGIDGRVKVADFGLARPNEIEGDELTKTNMVMGTPAYMAPEQRMGHADQRADIFALGVMLYEMLTGKRPQGAFDPPSHKVQVDVRIDDVVLRALQCEPERRYQQVSEMRGDVEHIRTTPLPAERPPAPAPKRRSWKWPLAVGVVLLALGPAVYRLFPGSHPGAEAKSTAGTPAGPTTPVVHEAARLVLHPPTPAPKPAVAPPTPAPIVVSATPRPAAARNEPMSTAGMKQVADIQFARGLGGFPEMDNQRWKLGLVNGEYQMLCRESGTWWPAQPLEHIRVNEFVCEVRARIFQNEVGGWGLGIVNGDGDNHSWVGVQVDGAGLLNSHTFANGAVDWPWEYSPAMKRGPEANLIRIEATGQRVRVFANGLLVLDRLHEKIRPNSNLVLFAFGKRPPEDVRILSVQVWTPTEQVALSGLSLLKSRQLAAAAAATPAPASAPPEELFSPQNIGFWKNAGGQFRMEAGAWTASHPQPGKGVVWFTKRTYSDFTLRLEYLKGVPTANSGVFIRSPTQLVDPNDNGSAYEIQIFGDPKAPQPTGAIYGIQPPTSVPQREGWNSMEITVVKQVIVVTLNGVVTNRFVGNRAPAGYLGLQCHHGGAVKFRNVRITDLSGVGR